MRPARLVGRRPPRHLVAQRRQDQPPEHRAALPPPPPGRAQTSMESRTATRGRLHSHRPQRPYPHDPTTRPDPEAHRLSIVAHGEQNGLTPGAGPAEPDEPLSR